MTTLKVEAKGNSKRKRELREKRGDQADGDRLNTGAPLLTRKLEGTDFDASGNGFGKMRTKIVRDNRAKDIEEETQDQDDISRRTDKEPTIPETDLGKITKRKKEMKVVVDPRLASETSTSADVIFSPNTQGTPYAARWAIKQNLERRMPGSQVRVLDVTGEGVAQVTVSSEFYVDSILCKVTAKCLCSASDIAVHTAVVECNGETFDVDPVDRPRSPEEAHLFMQKLATNTAKSAAKE